MRFGFGCLFSTDFWSVYLGRVRTCSAFFFVEADLCILAVSFYLCRGAEQKARYPLASALAPFFRPSEITWLHQNRAFLRIVALVAPLTLPLKRRNKSRLQKSTRFCALALWLTHRWPDGIVYILICRILWSQSPQTVHYCLLSVVFQFLFNLFFTIRVFIKVNVEHFGNVVRHIHSKLW